MRHARAGTALTAWRAERSGSGPPERRRPAPGYAAAPNDAARRRFLGSTVAAAFAALAFGGGFGGLARLTFAQSGTRSIAADDVANGLVRISGVGGNALLYKGADGAALVDSGSPEDASALAKYVNESLGGAPVDVLFNTHWHTEHTGANETFGREGARIVAHENTRLWMSTEYYVDWQDRTYGPRPAAALPTETFFSSDPQPIALDIGGERIEYGHLREAHTDGDIYVFFRDRNVIATGDVVTAGAYPILDYATGGWIGGLMDATRKLIELGNADTIFVPGTGAAQSRDHLERQYEMVAAVRERVETMMRQGKSAEEMLAAGVTAEFDSAWGQNRARFIANVYGGLWWQGRLDGSL